VLVYRQKQLQLIATAIQERNLKFHIKTREIDRETGQEENLNVSSNRTVIKPKEEEPKISLMTIHAAKGLAFDVVMLPGLAHGLFPGNPSDARRDLMLLMVGLTRTRYLAYLSYPKVGVNQGGRMERAGPSPFLSLLPPILHES
jgi:superfamily I DNA/RNA helicase